MGLIFSKSALGSLLFWNLLRTLLPQVLTQRGDLFAQGFAWLTHSFIQESTQMSSPKRGLPWPHNLKRRFLPIPSNLLFSFSLLCNILNLYNECLPSLEWEGPGYRACSVRCWIIRTQRLPGTGGPSDMPWTNCCFLPECRFPSLLPFLPQIPRTVVPSHSLLTTGTC